MLDVNKLYNMDCIDFLKSIDDNMVDLIVTSPPYNCNLDYDICNDNMEMTEYLEWCEKWLIECYRILKPDGRICINHYLNQRRIGNKIKDWFPIMEIKNIKEKVGLTPHKLIIWMEETITRMTAWGSWLSASAPNITNPCEGIIVSYKHQWKKENRGESTITKEEFMRDVSGVWRIQPDTRSLTKASFPVELPKRCIQLLTYKGDLVVDPFMGSGSTALAAIETNRNFIGCDLSSNYCSIANERIKKYYLEEKNKYIHKNFFV